MADIFVNFVDSNNQTFIWGPNNSCDQGDYPQLLVPGLLDHSCCVVLVKQHVQQLEGWGRDCVACGDPTTAAKETYLWPTADFGIMFGEKSELTAVILAGNFNEANEVMVRIIPQLTQHVCDVHCATSECSYSCGNRPKSS